MNEALSLNEVHTSNVDAMLRAETTSIADTEQLTNQHTESLSDTPSESVHEPETINNEPKEELTTIDEYGIEIPKQEKVYTKAEVDALVAEQVRQRIARASRNNETPQYPQNPQPQQQAQQPQAEGDWEGQLNSVIDQRIAAKEQAFQQQKLQQQALENQTQFEIKFNQGMAKYPDFNEVIYGKPLTPEMVLATQGMTDPAAFIYAASKTQAPELERISKISNPYVQAVEIGQLAERMRKARNPVSQAPRPVESPRGDVSDKVQKVLSVDDRLRIEEKKRVNEFNQRRLR